MSATPPARAVMVMEPSDKALVLGSSQPAGVADAEACREAGVGIVRRRSGGGAVLVEPGAQLWVDIALPVGDPLFEADVGRAAWWVGEAWASALRASGLAGASVWKGPLVRRPWSDLACFAMLGAGEVTVAGQSDDGRTLHLLGTNVAGTRAPAEGHVAKLVGIAQRRTRTGALFQCSCLLRWEPAELVGLLALAPEQREQAAKHLSLLAGPVPAVRPGDLLEEFLAALPEP